MSDASTTHYKVTNTTKWAGVSKGKHKKGFIIAINRKNVHVGRHMVFQDLNEGLEALQQKKYIKIEVLKDRHVTIGEKIREQEKANEADRKAAAERAIKAVKDDGTAAKLRKDLELKALKITSVESKPASSLDKDALKRAAKESFAQNTASVSGDGEGSSTDPLADVEKANYTDGKEPNFIVKAGKNKKNARKTPKT